MKNILMCVSSIKKLVQISLTITMLFYSSYSLAYKEYLHVEFYNQTDNPVFYKFTILGGSPIYGIIEPNNQSNVIELGEIYPKFAFNYDFILRDAENGKKLVDEAVNYSEEEGYREYLQYLNPDYKLAYNWVGNFNIRYEIKKR